MKLPDPEPPKAASCPETSTHHGRSRQDDFAWLKAPDWLAVLNAEAELPKSIHRHLELENRYATDMLKPLQALQDDLLQELKGRIEDEEIALPVRDGPYEYYWRYTKGSEHPLFARTPTSGGAEEILLDAEHEARGHDFFELGDFEISPDHKHLAWCADRRGAELAQLHVRNLQTGEDSAHVIEHVGTVTWIDNDHLLYTAINAAHRASDVYRHHPFSPAMSDTLIFHEQDPAFEVTLGRMRSGRFVEIASSTDGQDEIWLLDTAEPFSEPRVFQHRQPGLEYTVDHQDSVFFVHTNLGGVVDFQIMTTPVEQTSACHWSVWRQPEAGVSILSVDVYRHWVIWLEQAQALPRIRFQDNHGNLSTIEFAEAAHELDYELSPEFDSQTFRFTYESPATPPQIWQYNLLDGTRSLLKSTHIPAGHDSADYRLRRFNATSSDGCEVPVTCLYHRLTPLDGTAPCVLEGYGSYGSSMPADFDSHRLPLVDRGIVYALAHVRGGEEKGHAWYADAKGALKQNSMNDFSACAKALCQRKICRDDALVALGRSAGGLLVGAVVNQEPHLFRGVVADVPFVDVLNTLLDASHPLTPGEWAQWGNPIENPQAYDWIARYSPYDNVAEQVYPAMLVTTALADPRVGYWEAAKWVAQLRRTALGDNPVLLLTNMSAGHAGASGRYAGLADMAREHSFIIDLLGCSEKLESTSPDASKTDT